jgi:repressor LexA
MKSLTKRQREVFDFLRECAHENGYWPSFREIQEHFGFRSTNAVMGHLRALEAKGVVTRVPGQARTFKLVDIGPCSSEAEEVVEIPVFGSIAAGYPDGVEQGDALGRLQVNMRSAGYQRKNFALRVRGDSMIGAGIFDGDTVVVEPKQPRLGDVVVALIDGESTLKRFYQNASGIPFLKSENENYPEMHPVGELVVQGVARSVIRDL